tara:strand:- start:19 stop:810 length:792 start_codon:yes stop_codon:yes gene_type:complete
LLIAVFPRQASNHRLTSQNGGVSNLQLVGPAQERNAHDATKMLFLAALTTCAFMLPSAPTPLTTRRPPIYNAPLQMDATGVKGGCLPQVAVAATVCAAVLLFGATTIVQPGEVGIVTTLGFIGAPLQAGFHFVSPLADVRSYSTKTILAEESTTVPTKEGLSVELDTALLYRLDPRKVQELIVSTGSDFERVVIQPEVRSIIRGLTSEVEAKALYTSGRGELQRKLKEDLSEASGPRHRSAVPRCHTAGTSHRPPWPKAPLHV